MHSRTVDFEELPPMAVRGVPYIDPMYFPLCQWCIDKKGWVLLKRRDQSDVYLAASQRTWVPDNGEVSLVTLDWVAI
jgi:hypothetical protein